MGHESEVPPGEGQPAADTWPPITAHELARDLLDRPDAPVRVSARTGRGDAICTDRFTVRTETDDEGSSVTIAAGWR